MAKGGIQNPSTFDNPNLTLVVFKFIINSVCYLQKVSADLTTMSVLDKLHDVLDIENYSCYPCFLTYLFTS